MKASYSRYIILTGTLIVFVTAWWVIAALVNNSREIVGPVQTGTAFISLFTDPPLTRLLASGLQVTITSILLGFALAVVVGVPVGVLMGRYLVVDLFCDPWVNIWYSIPAIAFVPLAMNWTGISATSSIIIAFLITVFTIIINVYSGVKNISGSLVDCGLAYGATQTQVMTKIILPATLPNIMVGLRLGISRAIEGVIIAEMVFTVVGLGGLMDDAADNLQLAFSGALIIVLAIISLAFAETMNYVARRAVAWKESQAMVRE
ncbi:MAG TPA: ABC transporter permease subunit [Nitrososphaerales archaeon]|nr:ABC transporter permease subunit [Nitrososphaerales archaeon]